MEYTWIALYIILTHFLNYVGCFTLRDDDDYETSESEWLWIFILCALLIVTLVIPFGFFVFTTKLKKILRALSIFYWILFWILLPFVIGCYSSTRFSRSSKSLDLVKVTGTYLLPVMWLVMLYESWKSNERTDIIQLKNNALSVVDFVQGKSMASFFSQ